MKPADAMKYLGKPYSAMGAGPDDFNCWGLLRWIQEKEFNRYLPEVPIGDGDATRQIHEDSLSAGLYELVPTPIHGDCVLLRGGDCPHVGVYLAFDGGGVLHSLEPVGVVFTPLSQLSRFGYGRRTFYRVRNNGESRNSKEPVPTDS